MRNSAIGVVALAACVCTDPVSADVTLSFPLEIKAADTVSSASYLCEGGEHVVVQYINSGVNSLALLTKEGQQRVFVNVISGSGARYVSGQYVWWVKGSNATLADSMAEDRPENCRLQEPDTSELTGE